MSRCLKFLCFISLFLCFSILGCEYEVRSGEMPPLGYSPNDDDDWTSFTTSETTTGNDYSTTGYLDSSTSSSSTTEYDPKFDVGNSFDNSCQKMDFLFVIDNSGSMTDNQANLINNFNGFIAGILGIDGTGDFHVGVITTDAYKWNSDDCSVLGGLVVETGAYTQPESVCGPWSEGNYMIASELADPDTGFACAANVGTAGGATEKPIDAIVGSMGPFLNSPGQCNEGFYRDDAKLVIVIITDEDDSSDGNITWWLDEIEFYRGSLDNVVILGLIPIPQSECAYTAIDLANFISSFQYSYIGDVCATDYAPLFQEALDVIEKACIPVG